ncbi:MAG: carboxypeptidase-like regulatory domain-containing protein [Chitinophagaceae bacterium]
MRIKFTKSKKTLSVFFLIFFFCSVSWRVHAQSLKEIKGTVNDCSTNAALPNVSVTVKGSSNGGVTDAKGKYSIQTTSDDILVFSFVGYETQEVEVGNRTVINVVLQTGSTRLGEVIVNVGYGTQRKATLTGSVASIGGKEVQSSPALNIGNSLAGLLPGIITKNTTGEPGRDDPTILVRDAVQPVITALLLW